MTLFISFRYGTTRALSETPTLWRRETEGPGDVTLKRVDLADFKRDIAGKRLVIVTHGFNVGHDGGARLLGQVRAGLGLTGDRWMFVGVLWPGDSVIPFVNYPLEARDAARCGQWLARFLNEHAAGAEAFAFASHSLGVRVVMDAIHGLSRAASGVCLLAAAADSDCLTKGYDRARRRSGKISVWSSTADMALRLAYPAGDFFSDITYDGDSPWRGALGYGGPRPPADRATSFPMPPKPKAGAYGHNDYFPSGDGKPPGPKARRVIEHMKDWLIT